MPERDEEDADEGQWVGPRRSPEEMVQFYDPTDLFGDLAETLAEQYPDVAPELDDDARPISRKPTSPRATEQETTSPPARQTSADPTDGRCSGAAWPWRGRRREGSSGVGGRRAGSSGAGGRR